MLSRLLRNFLFKFIHFLVNVFVTLQNVYRRFLVKKYNLFKNEVTKTDIKMILEHVPRMRKRLKHLVVLANSEHHSLRDLAHIVIWSLVAGVPYVSFHDVTGELKECEEDLFLEVEKNKKGVPGYIKWTKKPDLNGYTNGIQAHTVNINIFTSNDGRPTIAQCIRQIAEEKLPCKRLSSEFTAQEMDESFALVYPSVPNPDVVLYTGHECCTHGLLPWQIRLTEFIQLSSDHNVDVNSYIGALYKYNKCDQRFGK